MNSLSLDHLVLTVADIDRTCSFYERALGLKTVVFGEGRRALAFGDQKINLHQSALEIAPHAARPTPGSSDLCFLTGTPLAEVVTHLGRVGVTIELGPVKRTGARGPILSVYFRDPDGNLLELANPIAPGSPA